MIKLALSDMDNTIVPMGARGISERMREAIHAATEAGVLFGPATGRDTVELFRFFRADETCYKTGVLSNGKRVLADGETVSLTLIPHEGLAAIADALRDREMFLNCYPTESNLLNPVYTVGAPSEEMVNRYEARLGFVGGRVDEVPEVDFVAATIACPGEAEPMEQQMADVERIVEEVAPDLRVVLPIPGWFDIMPKGVSKASGLDALLAATGFAEDEVVVFGDAANDLEILRKVKYSVAVANATDEVKEAAGYHIGACADDAVADALLEIARAAKCGEMPEFLRG
ncbi:HAD family hydrolase [Paratractidigestivibacter sp.]|uniref:HAD family hydrolase n=1 Tax=Paratractidigestivibacter sp. TaxID=2847316 RepID=UPI002ABDE142|nr:HAD family hydrolase [Paratractidigestivibacter sp.]